MIRDVLLGRRVSPTTEPILTLQFSLESCSVRQCPTVLLVVTEFRLVSLAA